MAKAIRTCQADTQANRLARERHTHIYKESHANEMKLARK